jgi:hypothetical protein
MTSQAYQKGETARSGQQKDDCAPARTISPAHQSTAATIGNNRRPYHWKRHNCQRRYVLKYLHLGLNREAQLTLNSRAQLALRSEAHLMPCGRQHKYGGTVSVSDGSRITLARVGGHTRQLVSLKLGRIAPVSKWNQYATSGLLLRPPPVGDN